MQLEFHFKKWTVALASVGQLVEHHPGHQEGTYLGLRAWSLVEGIQKAANRFFSLSFSPSSLSKNQLKSFFLNELPYLTYIIQSNKIVDESSVPCRVDLHLGLVYTNKTSQGTIFKEIISFYGPHISITFLYNYLNNWLNFPVCFVCVAIDENLFSLKIKCF